VCAYALMFSFDDIKDLENPFVLEEFQLVSKMLLASLSDEKDQIDCSDLLMSTLKKMNEISKDMMVYIDFYNFGLSLKNSKLS